MQSITYDLRETLNDREKEIYRLLCELKSNPQIAEEIGIKPTTIKYHLKSIYQKLGIEAENNQDKQLARARAIAYSGTKVEQSVKLENSSEGRIDKQKLYSMANIRNAGKKTGLTKNQIDDLLSFLEMDRE